MAHYFIIEEHMEVKEREGEENALCRCTLRHPLSRFLSKSLLPSTFLHFKLILLNFHHYSNGTSEVRRWWLS